MSPTYRTASQIKQAARTHGWEIRPAIMEGSAWTLHKDHNKAEIFERRDGGLCWVRFTYPVSGGSNCDYLGARYRGKLEEVLRFLENPLCRRKRYPSDAGNDPGPLAVLS